MDSEKKLSNTRTPTQRSESEGTIHLDGKGTGEKSSGITPQHFLTLHHDPSHNHSCSKS